MPGKHQQLVNRLKLYVEQYSKHQATLQWFEEIVTDEFRADYSEFQKLVESGIDLEDEGASHKLVQALENMSKIIALQKRAEGFADFTILTKDDPAECFKVLSGRNKKPISITIQQNIDIKAVNISTLLTAGTQFKFFNCKISPELANSLLTATKPILLTNVQIEPADLKKIIEHNLSLTKTSASAAATLDQKSAPASKPFAITTDTESDISYEDSKVNFLEIKGDVSLGVLHKKLQDFPALFPANAGPVIKLSGINFKSNDDKLIYNIKPNNQITELTLENINANPNFIAAIFQWFPNLKTLRINNCQLDQKSFSTLIQQLENNKQLNRLEFQHCNFTSVARKELTDVLSNANNQLSQIAFDGKDVILMKPEDFLTWKNFINEIETLLQTPEANKQNLLKRYSLNREKVKFLQNETPPLFAQKISALFQKLENHVFNQFTANWYLDNPLDGITLLAKMPFTQQQVQLDEIIKAIPNHGSIDKLKAFLDQIKLTPPNSANSLVLERLLLKGYDKIAAGKWIQRANVSGRGYEPIVSIPIVDDVYPANYTKIPELKDDLDNSFIATARIIYRMGAKKHSLYYYTLPDSFITRFQAFSSNHPHYTEAQKFLTLHYRTKILEHFEKYLGVGLIARDDYRGQDMDTRLPVYDRVTDFVDFHDVTFFQDPKKQTDNAAIFLRGVSFDPNKPLTMQKLYEQLKIYFDNRKNKSIWADDIKNKFNDSQGSAPSRAELQKLFDQLTALISKDEKHIQKSTSSAVAIEGTATAAAPVTSPAASAPPLSDAKDSKSNLTESVNLTATAAAVTATPSATTSSAGAPAISSATDEFPISPVNPLTQKRDDKKSEAKAIVQTDTTGMETATATASAPVKLPEPSAPPLDAKGNKQITPKGVTPTELQSPEPSAPDAKEVTTNPADSATAVAVEVLASGKTKSPVVGKPATPPPGGLDPNSEHNKAEAKSTPKQNKPKPTLV